VSATAQVIEVYADIACPFTHVGLTRFVQRRDELGRDDVALRVRAWSLERVNGRPLDPIVVAEEVAAIRDQVAPDLFTAFDETSFPATSLPAFALAAAAYRRDVKTGERVSLALRRRLFEEGVDVADPTVLAQLAAEHELVVTDADRASIDRDHATGVDHGVIGSPHFMTPAGGFFCPALDISRDADGRFRIRADAGAFDDFLASCFT
jgi:predicted DsbA family dithiol-disulfide isomerase